VEPLSSAEPQLKITALPSDVKIKFLHNYTNRVIYSHSAPTAILLLISLLTRKIIQHFPDFSWHSHMSRKKLENPKNTMLLLCHLTLVLPQIYANILSLTASHQMFQHARFFKISVFLNKTICTRTISVYYTQISGVWNGTSLVCSA